MSFKEALKDGWLKENIAPVLSLAILTAVFALFSVILFINVSEEKEKIAFTVLGALITLSTTVANYYFGSSAGSNKKTDMFRRRLDDCDERYRHVVDADCDDENRPKGQAAG